MLKSSFGKKRRGGHTHPHKRRDPHTDTQNRASSLVQRRFTSASDVSKHTYTHSNSQTDTHTDIHDNKHTLIRTENRRTQHQIEERLQGGRFRHLNEVMYTHDSSHVQKMFKINPQMFVTYHEGHRLQTSKWPLKPTNLIIR